MRILIGLLTVALASPLAANEPETIQARQQGTQLVWSVPADHPGASLNLVSPDGQVQSIDFAAGMPVELDLSEMARTEGQYIYELSIKPQVDAGQREALQAARERGETLDLGLNGVRLTGAFQTINDNWYGADSDSTSVMEDGDLSGDVRPPGGTISDVIVGDLSVQGSLCAGDQCASVESFGMDTIRIKEDNTRLTFIDVSTITGYPAGDWQLRANDNASGGANFMAIDWLGTGATGGAVETTPFRVEGGAPNNALWIEASGDVGVGTPTPAVELHVRDGDTPALRLEQNNSSGFTPQTWDLAGNETNFFLRDVTNGSQLTFRVFPNAGDDMLVIRNGRVGINAENPAAQLHLNGGDLFVDGNSGFGINPPVDRLHVADGNALFEGSVGIGTLAPTAALQVVGGVTGLEGDVGVGTSSPAARLHVTGGDMRVDGNTGLGIDVPLGRLHVANGNAQFDGNVFVDGNSGFGTSSPQSRLHVAGGDAIMEGNLGVGTSAPTARLHVAGGDLRVDGNVGVGTGTPEARLHVAGGDLRVDGAVYQLSSRAAKTDLTAMNAGRLLELLSNLDLFNWRYQAASDQGLHFGPTAEDFYTLFGLGDSDRHISVTDMAGVALGAAQALQQELAAKDEELERMNARLERLERMLDALQSE